MRSACVRSSLSFVIIALVACDTGEKEWTGAVSDNWADPGNWVPAGVPTATDAVELGTLTPSGEVNVLGVFAAASVRVSEGMTVSIGDGSVAAGLDVREGLELATGIANSTLRIHALSTLALGTDAVATQALTVQANGVVQLQGGSLSLGAPAVVHSGATLRGAGQVTLVGANSSLAVDGALEGEASETLSIVNPMEAVIDLDGPSEAGRLDLTAPDTIISIEGPHADPVSGSVELGMGAELQFWDTGDTIIDGPLSVASNGDIALIRSNDWVGLAGAVDISGALDLDTLTRIDPGTTINVPTPTDRILFVQDMDYAGGTASGLGRLLHRSSIDVTGAATASVGIFDLDGIGSVVRHLHVHSGGTLAVNANNVDEPGGLSDGYDGGVTIDAGGTLAINTPGSWSIAGALEFRGTATQNAVISGAPFSVIAPSPFDPFPVDVQDHAQVEDFTLIGEMNLRGTIGDLNDPAMLTGDDLVFAPTSRLNVNPESRSVIQANTLDLGADVTLVNTRLEIQCTTPWRLQGEIHAQGGSNNIINGSPLIVGTTGSGPAFLNASEPMIVNADVILESTATVEAILTAALGSITFNGEVVLQGPNFNANVGPFDTTGMSPTQPSTVRFLGDVFVEQTSTIFAGFFRMGDSIGNTTHSVSIAPNQTLTIDAHTLVTTDDISMTIHPGATFEVIIRHLTTPEWTNAMDLTLDHATLASSPLIHEGALRGVGTLLATIIDGSGLIAPGPSTDPLEIMGDVALNGATFEIDLGGPTGDAYDRVVVNGSLMVADSQLSVELINGFIPQIGDSFTILSASAGLGLDFTTLDLPPLPRGRQWDTSGLGLGQLSVVAR